MNLPSSFYRAVTISDDTYRPGAENLAVEYSITKGQVYSYADDTKKLISKILIFHIDEPLTIQEKSFIRRLCLQGFKIQPIDDFNKKTISSDLYNTSNFLKLLPEENRYPVLHVNENITDITAHIALCHHKEKANFIILSKALLSELAKNQSDFIFPCDMTYRALEEVKKNFNAHYKDTQWVITEFSNDMRNFIQIVLPFLNMSNIHYIKPSVETTEYLILLRSETDFLEKNKKICLALIKSVETIIIRNWESCKLLDSTFTQLKHLNIEFPDFKFISQNKLFDQFIHFSSFSQLESLYLITNTSFTTGSKHQFGFKKITLSGSIIFSELCELIENSPNLEELIFLDFTVAKTQKNWHVINKPILLKKLHFSGNCEFSSSYKLILEKSCLTLEEIIFDIDPGLSLPNCIFPSLKNFKTNESDLVFYLDKINKKLKDCFPVLESLSIKKAMLFNLSEAIGDTLALKSLYLHHTHITLTPLYNIIKKCTILEILDLRGCSYLPEKYQQYFTIESIQQLIVDIQNFLITKNTNSNLTIDSLKIEKNKVSSDENKINFQSQAIYLDANTQFNKTTYHQKKIFYAIERKNDPKTESYRLLTYNTLDINAEQCKKEKAFSLSNKNDPFFLTVSNIVAAKTDLYEKLTTLKKDNNEFFYGKLEITISHQWQALPSLFPNEILIDYHIAEAVSVEINYSQRDNLYYIRNIENTEIKTTLDFIIQHPLLHPKPLPEAIEKIMAFIASFGVDSNSNTPENQNGYAYLEQMIARKVGACRHRAAAFIYLLSKSEASKAEKTPVRYIMNDSHAYVEVNIEGIWITCDLGGYEATSILDERFQPKRENLALPQIKSKTDINCALPSFKKQKFISSKAQAVDQKTKGIAFFKSCFSEKSVLIKSPLTQKQIVFEEKLSNSAIKAIIHEAYPFHLRLKDPEKNYFLKTAINEKIALKCYLEKLCHGESDRHLLKIEGQATGLSYHLQKYCLDTNLPIFYINNPDALICAAPIIKKTNGNAGKIIHGPSGQFYDFIQKYQHTRCIVFINFNTFTEEDQVKFNTLLDDIKSIDGISLPQKSVLIGMIDSSPSQDLSFYSRFGEHVENLPYSVFDFPLPLPFSAVETDHYKINLYGSKHWESILTGAWYLNGHTPYFQEGKLIEAIRLNHQKIMLANPPNDPNFERFFREIQLYGLIKLSGESITLPDNFTVSIAKKHLFLEAKGSYSYHFPPKDLLVVNEHLLLPFFYRDSVDRQNKIIIRKPGFLEENAGNALSIYVSDHLSEDQWEHLFDQAKKYEVTLNLYLAEQVVLPDGLNLPQKNEESEKPNNQHTIFLRTQDRDLSLQLIKHHDKEVIVIDISELKASDLLKKVSARYNKETLEFVFSEKDMFLLKALQEEKTIVFHGTPKTELVHQLTPLLLKRSYDLKTTAQLVFVSESENVFGSLVMLAEEESQLDDHFLFPIKNNNPSKKLCHLQAEERLEKPWIGMRASFSAVIPDNALVLQEAEQQSLAFNKERIRLVAALLAHSPFVFLAGATGIGKTSFVEKYWHNPDENRIVYREHEFEKWVHDDRDQMIKTLFIDEATLTQKNWSQFEGLFFDPPSLLLDDRIVYLSKNHKIIFAGNPVSYSEDRNLPELFERHGNAVAFHPLPAYYVFHEMLRPLFHHTPLKNLAEAVSQPILTIYHDLLLKNDREVLITPREMTMAVMLTIAYCDKHHNEDPIAVAHYFAYELAANYGADTILTLDRPSLQLEKSHFLITPSQQNHVNLLQDFLTLRDFRRNHSELSNQQQHAGLGAFVLEGDPGLGKSVLMRIILLANHFSEHHLQDPLTTHSVFYQVPITFSLQMKKEILTKAYFEGSVVIWDEMNCGASMEKCLNDLMMGKIPSDSFIIQLIEDSYFGLTPKPGFLILGTQNSAKKFEGRHETSLAIQHRSHTRFIKDYPSHEKELILSHIGLPLNYAKAMIDEYESKSEAQQLTFRHLTKKAKQVAHAYHDEQEKFNRSRVIHEEKMHRYELLLNSEETPYFALQALAKEVLNAKMRYCIVRHPNANDTVYQTLLNHTVIDEKTLYWIVSQTNNRNLLYQIIHHPIATEIIKTKAMENALKKQDKSVHFFSMPDHDLKERLVFILEILNARYDGKRDFLKKLLLFSKEPAHSASMIIAEISKQTQLGKIGKGRMYHIFKMLDQQLKNNAINIDTILIANL